MCIVLIICIYITAIPEHMRSNIVFMRGVKYVESLDGENDAITNLSVLTTIEGKPLSTFINELPFVNLTPGKANDVKFDNFDKLAEQMEEFRKKAAEDSERIAKLQAELIDAKKSGGLLEQVFGAIGNTLLPVVGGAIGEALGRVIKKI